MLVDFNEAPVDDVYRDLLIFGYTHALVCWGHGAIDQRMAA